MTRKRLPLTRAPDALSEEQRTRLREWLAKSHPRLLRRALELEEACLDHHRGRGNLMADWLACVRTWVRNEASGIYSHPPRPLITSTFLPRAEAPDRLAQARRDRDADPPTPQTLAAAKAAMGRYLRRVT